MEKDNDNEFYFSNILNEDEENVPLSQIVKRDIKLVEFSCLYKKNVKAKGLLGLFGFTKEISETKTISIQDPQKIIIYYDSKGRAFVNFSCRKEFDKVTTDGCDLNTISKKDTEMMCYRYQIDFLIGNLTGLGW